MPEKKKGDVVVAGELNVDVLLNHIRKFPARGKEVIADQMTITLGSSSASFASNLSVLGAKVAFAGTMVTYAGAMLLLCFNDIPEELLRQSRHLHVSSIFLTTPEAQLQAAIQRGIVKVNLATETKNIFMRTLKDVLSDNEEIGLRKVFPKATQSVKSPISQKLGVVSPE